MATVTIRDVAKRAGVGIATVSRVLNESPLVSDETRHRVQTAIADLDYSPSAVARRLSRGKSMAVAVIAPFFTRRSYVERLQGIENVLSTAGYDSFYVFLFLMLAALSIVLSWPALAESRRPWSDAPRPLAFGALAVLLVAALFLGARSNVRGVQADMIYKRAKPFDDQATRASGADPAARREVWDAAIAIYEQAIARTPEEDFYYLFLGRAPVSYTHLTLPTNREV